MRSVSSDNSARFVFGRPGRGRSFTLVELLVVMAILAVLLSILLPAFASVRSQARTLLCLNNMRAIGFRFGLFVNGDTATGRGDSDIHYGTRFSAWDFQESLYRADEFWPTVSDPEEGRLEYTRGRDPILCGALPTGLACVAPGFSLESGRAVAPAELVGYAMNRRLAYAPYTHTFPYLGVGVTMGQRILDHPNVPLFFDVDAGAAIKRWGNGGTFFSAPPGEADSVYGNANDPAPYWFPSKRHDGNMIVSFVGGHVAATDDPLKDSSWDWEYHPPVNP